MVFAEVDPSRRRVLEPPQLQGVCFCAIGSLPATDDRDQTACLMPDGERAHHA